jgi:predicted Fe-Mo cluster-binding NifX family protein
VDPAHHRLMLDLVRGCDVVIASHIGPPMFMSLRHRGTEVLGAPSEARKKRALAAYTSIFAPGEDHLLALYEAEDQFYGRMVGVRCAEIFRTAAPLLVPDPTVFVPVPQG